MKITAKEYIRHAGVCTDPMRVTYDEIGVVESMTLRAPLTPTKNVAVRSHRMASTRLRASLLRALEGYVLVFRASYIFPHTPIFERARLDLWRCHSGTIDGDPINVVAGASELIDVLLMNRPRRPGLGLLIDDDEQHLVQGTTVGRAKRSWPEDMPGPATWLRLTRLP